MDMTATSAPAYDVLPVGAHGSRWRLRRKSAVDAAPKADEAAITDLEVDAVDALDHAHAAALEASLQAQESLDAAVVDDDSPAPVSSFGRWLADLESPQPAEPKAEVSDEPKRVAVAPLPSPEPISDDEQVRNLTHEIKLLSDELDTLRQRSAAERMRLLEELANAREARHAAEKELAAMQAVLDAAEQQIPRPRSATLSYATG